MLGECRNPNCLLSHSRTPERVPHCGYFLRGSCTRAGCPFVHVRVDPQAPLCPDFAIGFCERGAECQMRHQFPVRMDMVTDGEAEEGEVAPARSGPAAAASAASATWPAALRAAAARPPAEDALAPAQDAEPACADEDAPPLLLMPPFVARALCENGLLRGRLADPAANVFTP